MTQARGVETATPAVGNIFGFAVAVRDRRAVLTLDRRVLGPGVVLEDFEAEIPGVRLPLRPSLRASSFRNRRCRARRLTLRLDASHIGAWLDQRLAGVRIATFVVEDVQLAFGPHARFERIELWCHVRGRHDDGRRSEACFGLSARIGQRRLEVVPIRAWMFGDGPEDAETIWARLAETVGHGRNIDIDPLRITLLDEIGRASCRERV
jgi:hypothetical protein